MTTFAQFLEQNIDEVVDEFELFARTSGPTTENLSSKELRDHAALVLSAIAADMAAAQGETAQHQKSLGRAVDGSFTRVVRTSRLHAQHRFRQGFTLPQMLSEYRALRASVIRRWREHGSGAKGDQLEELTRFGEAVDEGLTEAIGWYSRRLEDSRNLLIGVMAHDLRGPLGAVRMSAEYLVRTDRLRDGELRAATRIIASTVRMAGYISSLLDVTQTLLGQGLPLARAQLNLAALCEDVSDELRAAHPNATVRIDVQRAPTGLWDGTRLSQLLSNLVTNAINHGAADRPVTITVDEADSVATLTVHNQGDPIPPDDMPNLFRPLMQAGAASRRHGSSGLGLGLYIAHEIAAAHGGTLQVESTVEAGTTFTVRLPLEQPA